MFLFSWIGRLLYGADYDELNKRVSKKRRRK